MWRAIRAQANTEQGKKAQEHSLKWVLPLSKTKVHFLCVATRGNKGTRHRGTSYGYRASRSSHYGHNEYQLEYRLILLIMLTECPCLLYPQNTTSGLTLYAGSFDHLDRYPFSFRVMMATFNHT